MKYVLLLLCALGIVVSSLAMREHYRTEGFAPCDINEKWDCGIVNQSPYAMVGKVPVAVIGIAGYLLMGVLAFRRADRLLLAPLIFGLGFSVYLATFKKDIPGFLLALC